MELLIRPYLLLIVAINWLSITSGQVCVPDHFMKHYQGNTAVYTGNIITTPQDDIVASGSTLKINGEFLDATDGWITKFSPRGVILWSRRYYIPGFNSGGFYSIENATDSSYLVTGRFGKYKKRDNGSLEQLDAASFLFHIDKFGNLIWAKRISQYIDDSFLSSIARLQDNNFLIAGNIYNSAGTKLLLLNVDLSANVNWYKLIFSDSSMFGSPAVKQLSNGTILAVGITQKNARNNTIPDQGYYFMKFDAVTGNMLSSKGIFINTSFSDIPTGHDNIKNIIELNNDTVLLCSSFSGDRFFGATPGTRKGLLLRTASNGQVHKADGISLVSPLPGFRLADATLANGKINLLLDNGYNTYYAEINRGNQVLNQREYSNVFSLLKGNRLIGGRMRNRIYYDGRGQYALMGLMKTEDDASIPCMETPSQITTESVSAYFRNGTINTMFISVSFPFSFEDFGGIGRAEYNFQATTDCIATCCDNIPSDTTHKEFCNAPGYRLPDNSYVKHTGIYYINTKNANNCDSIAYYDLRFSFKPKIDLGADTCFTNSQPIVLKVDSGFTNYNWMGINSPNHVYKATVPGKYTVSVANPCGTTVDQIEIYNDCEFPVYMPTGFTPNNDGLNDVYLYPALNKNRFVSLKIYDRYGQEVFGSADSRKGWNGKFKNKDQSIGIYVYMLQILTLDGRKILKKGTFTLLR
jgi:gliding motility-associated-like protein